MNLSFPEKTVESIIPKHGIDAEKWIDVTSEFTE